MLSGELAEILVELYSLSLTACVPLSPLSAILWQEVDRIQYHAETLKKAGYSYKYSKGYLQKEHGLMLAWRCKPKQNGRSSDAIFEQEPVASEILFYDDAEVSAGRTACSRLTRNIALFLAIKFQPTDGERDHTGPAGVILATTHLFWHPMHAYERVRQASLLARYLQSFRNKEGATWSSWPTVLAGDFNDQPHSASYALLTGRGLDNHGRAEIEQSSVVHQSVDKRTEAARRRPTGALQDPAGLNNAAEPLDPKETSREDDVDHIDGDPTGDEEEQEAADDQMLKSCRAATTSDGLLTPEDLIALFNTSHKPTSIGCESVQPAPGHMLSAYGSKYALLQDPQESDNMFSTSTRGRERWDDQDWKDGDLNVHRHLAGTTAGSEPMCTLYSSLFALTLDFIFLLPFKNNEGSPVYPAVTRLLRTHRTEVVKEGLPRKGICVSDHMAIGAELEF